MKNIFIICISAIGFSYSMNTLAANVGEGTYIGGNGNRANISSYRDQGIYNYSLLLANMKTQDFYQLYSVQQQPLQVGKLYKFNTLVSDYNEDSDVSQCSITAVFGNDHALELIGDDKCIAERSRLGLFMFSQQASFIPEQYWGKWGNTSQCKGMTAIIQKDWLTNDRDYGGALVLNIESNQDRSLDIDGVEIYEDVASSSNFNIRLINNKLHIKGTHHASDFNETMVKCNDQTF